MMRKLALTVFAMSLTLAGCGSSSSTKKADAATDAVTSADTSSKADVIVSGDTAPKTDVVVIGDVPAADVAVDSLVPTDVAPLTDVAGDVAAADARDGGAVTDTNKPGDTNKLPDGSVAKLDTAPVDAPAADAAPAGDAGGDAQAD